MEKQGGGAEEFSFAPMMRVMELSATHRDSDVKAFTIDAKDRKNKDIKARLRATKNLHLEKVEKAGKEVCDRIVELAVRYNKNDSPQRVVVYVRSPQDAAKIAVAIDKELGSDANGRVCVLSGEIRGYERDELLDRPDMQPFTGKAEATWTVYLVATSAGEVGMDLHADHAVCDLSTLDSLIQRLGRVNRFGQTEARIDLVYEETPNDSWRAKTLKILSGKQDKDGCIDVCPDALLQWMQEDDLREAFSQPTDMVELTDILTDLWSQTSLYKVPARPAVAPWLHGIEDNLPDTWVTWRKELKPLFAYKNKNDGELLADNELVDDRAVGEWFRAARLGSKEKLRQPTHRFLDALRKKSGEPTEWVKSHMNTWVVVISAKGEARAVTLGRLAQQSLEFATVVLPTELGGLNEGGFFDPTAKNENLDVAFQILAEDKTCSDNDKFERIVLMQKGSNFYFGAVGEDGTEELSDGKLSSAIRQVEKDRQKRLTLKIQIQKAEEHLNDDESEERWLLLLQALGKNQSVGNSSSPTAAKHNEDVAKLVAKIADSFGLPEPFKDALRLAGLHHDTGKTDDCWQKAAGHAPCENVEQAKAKPESGGVDWRKLDGYRHELGSLVKAYDVEDIKGHEERDLILHLIATHHGWARPHFEADAFPPGTDDQLRAIIHHDVMLRYVRLQERFGHWRLAWIESLLRRADGIVSASYNETFTEEGES